MILNRTMITADSNDAALVVASLSGNRDAFTQIVSRYQSLICSLAYNSTGSLSQSEDLAQETFVIAWRKMKELHEPEKLRAWLCGIARNVISNSWRRNKREPAQGAEPIESAREFPAPETPTPERAIQREEEAILWRSLEKIPETYREPLILFYRQGESIERVAQQLELSEDAVKQRLSRGRKFLADEVTAFVEGALKQSTPGRAFTMGVLASLPVFATSAGAATISAGAVKGSVTATSSAAVAWFGVLLGPIIGLLGAYLGVKASINATRTPRERAYVVQQAKRSFAAAMIFNVVLFVYIFAAVNWWKQFPVLFVLLGIVIPLTFAIWMVVMVVRHNRILREIRREEQQLHPEAFADEIKPGTPTEYRSKRTLFGLPLIHVRHGTPLGEKSRPAVGWIAIGERAYGILFASGGIAVGGISMGGVSIGIISMGGASVGLLAFGGLAVGGLAIGGIAVGVMAAGGVAMAWLGAQGGLAIAREFAIGGGAIALHANDAAAIKFFERFPWMDMRNTGKRNILMTIIWLPLIVSVLTIMLRKKLKQSRS